MKLKIHRGSHEIGGTCIEVVSNGFTLVLDLGLPLEASHNGEESTIHRYLPGIPALVDVNAGPAALILSHAHADHSGLAGLCRPELPVYATTGTKVLLDVSRIFGNSLPLPTTFVDLPKRVPLPIGPFTVTAFPVPHSAPDAVALLIEAEGRRVFYSGDFRASGRTAKYFEDLVRMDLGHIDLMFIEGTTLLGQGKDLARKNDSRDESEVEQRLVDLCFGNPGLVYLCCSGQNIDRLVSCFRSAKRSGRTLVLDLHAAYILHRLHFLSSRLPQFDWDGVRIKFWKHHADALAAAGELEFLHAANRTKIRLPEIVGDPGRYLFVGKANHTLRMVWRKLSLSQNKGCSAREELREMIERTMVPAHKGGIDLTLIWSLWRGYWATDFQLRDWCNQCCISPEFVHAGGHADPEALTRLAEALGPDRLIPVHTRFPEQFPRGAREVFVVRDLQEVVL